MPFAVVPVPRDGVHNHARTPARTPACTPSRTRRVTPTIVTVLTVLVAGLGLLVGGLPTSGALYTGGTSNTGSWASAATFGGPPPPPPPAAVFVRAHQTGKATAVGLTNLKVVVDAAIPTVAGDTLVAWISVDNYADASGTSTTPKPTSIAVAPGESASWVLAGGHCAAPGLNAKDAVVGWLYLIKTTVAWPAGGSYTVTFPTDGTGPAAKTSVLAEFANLSVTPRAGAGSNTACNATGTKVSVADTGAQDGDILLAGFSAEGNVAPTAGASTGSTVPTTWTTIGALTSNAAGTFGGNVAASLSYTGPTTGAGTRAWLSTTAGDQGALVVAVPRG